MIESIKSEKEEEKRDVEGKRMEEGIHYQGG